MHAKHTLRALAIAASACLLPAQKDEPLSMEIFFGKRPKEFKVAKWGPKSLPSPWYAFRCEKLLTGVGAPIHDAVLVTHDSKIVAVGKRGEVDIPEGCQVFDLGNRWIVPGLVDLHCHMMGRNRRDYNDMVNPTNPELRTLDMVSMDHPQVKSALAGGVTTVLFIPGSGTNMGGFGTLVKTAGTFEEALVRFPGSLKIAQAGNPERRAGDLGVHSRWA